MITKCVDTPRTTNHCSCEVFYKTIAVCVIANNILPAVTTGHQVVNRAGILNAQSSYHALN